MPRPSTEEPIHTCVFPDLAGHVKYDVSQLTNVVAIGATHNNTAHDLDNNNNNNNNTTTTTQQNNNNNNNNNNNTTTTTANNNINNTTTISTTGFTVHCMLRTWGNPSFLATVLP